jgi:FHA domain
MSEDIILLLLRSLAGLSLLCFMGLLTYFLYRDQQRAAETIVARKRSYGRLVVVSNGASKPPFGTILPLLTATTFGRSPTNTIQIVDRFASGEHARVVQRMGQWWLEDQHSSNGTQLNGMPVEEPVVLSSGDVITVGSVQFRLELD